MHWVDVVGPDCACRSRFAIMRSIALKDVTTASPQVCMFSDWYVYAFTVLDGRIPADCTHFAARSSVDVGSAALESKSYLYIIYSRFQRVIQSPTCIHLEQLNPQLIRAATALPRQNRLPQSVTESDYTT